MNVAAAAVIAIALLAKPEGAFAVAALLLSIATLVAFVLSRTTGLFGFTEAEFDVKAAVAAAAEIVAIVATGAWFAATHPRPGAAPVVGEREAVGKTH